MKKFVLATLAILGVVLGIANLSAPANAAAVYLYSPSDHGGDNQ
jgi:hypothetical protein